MVGLHVNFKEVAIYLVSVDFFNVYCSRQPNDSTSSMFLLHFLDVYPIKFSTLVSEMGYRIVIMIDTKLVAGTKIANLETQE